MLGVSLLKVIFAFKDTFHANGTTFFFFFPKKETHICFLYVYIKEEAYFLFFIYICSIYISIHFFLHFSRAGTVHTPGTEACHTCIAFAFYSWLAGRHNVIQAVLHLVSVCTNSEHTHTHTGIFSLTLWVFCVTPIQPYIMCNLAPASPGSATLPRWHQIRGRGSTADATSFKWSSKSSAARLLWHMQRGARNGWKLEQDRSKVSGGFKWRVHGLAQGCRQIHEWEVGGEGKQGKKGQC